MLKSLLTGSGSVGLVVLVHGKPIKEYAHNGETFLEGRHGSPFSLRFINDSPDSLLFVPTIDGLSVINGKEGDYGSSGYILDGNSHTDVPGWRLDDDRVAQFFFSHFDEAYAAQMGNPTNIGVIGCAVFRKKPLPSGLRAKGFDSTPLSFDGGTRGLGTGFGKELSHQVQQVSFDRETSPAAVLILRYDTREALEAMGVPMKPVTAISAFPAEPSSESGCPPPPGWQGAARR